MDNKLFSDPRTRRTQIAYVLQAALEFLASQLVSDSFLAKLLTNAGLDQASIGIISSVLMFASFSQLLIVFIQRRLKQVRVWVTVFKMLSMCFYTAVYFMPLMHLSAKMNTILAYTLVIGGALCSYLVSTLNRQWGFSYVSSDHRGRFVAVVEGFSLLVGIGCSLGAGWLVDHGEAQGNLQSAFILLGIAIGVFTVLDLVVLLSMQEPPSDMVRTDSTAGRLWRELLNNRPFRRVVFMQSLTSMACCTTAGFLGTYKTVELGFSLWTLQIFTMLNSVIRICLSIPIGRFSDRHNYISGYILGTCFSLVAYAAVIFTAPGTRYLILIFIIFNSLADACARNNGDNLLYYYVPFSDYAQALSVTHSITGLFGIGASLVGSTLMRAVASHRPVIFGVELYAQQLQAMLSLLLTVAVLLYAVRNETFRQSRSAR